MNVSFDMEDLRPLVEAVVIDVIERFGGNDRLAFTEKESAALLGFARHVLRDLRLRGQINGIKIGARWYYTRAGLVEWLRDQEGK